jgi:alkanesulfonate monooxygenase SsuD/methylene tetrahydromethanopterin reductase-like flavin-dependent oxidoreductase (luciferase family)
MKISWMQRFGWENNAKGLMEMAKTLDDAGVYSVLLPYGSTSPDYFAWLPDLIHGTKNLKFMMALRPYTFSPEYASRVFRTAYEVHRDRVTFNVVAGALSPEEQEYSLKYYAGDPEDINTIDKRIAFTDKWTELFCRIFDEQFGPIKPEMYTIANSPITLELANKYMDCAIYHHHRLEHNMEHGRKGLRHVIVIDPLITNDDGTCDVEYLWQPTSLEKANNNKLTRDQIHPINGTYEEVKQQLINMSLQHGITEFLVHTDQKDISKILRLVKELSTL